MASEATMNGFIPSWLLPSLIVLSTASAQQSLVVPSAYQSMDAPSRLWVAGVCDGVRQQTLIGSSHLGPLVGRSITALGFRRTAADETYNGGSAQLSVMLSTSPNGPLDGSKSFAANTGLDAVLVFQGIITVPTSPPEVGPSVPWSPANVIQIQFSQPFVYLGGTLCVDVTGTTVAGQISDWWMADAAYDFAIGSVSDLGPGCGPFANQAGRWSWVSPHSLLPGGQVEMRANGPENNWAAAAIGPPGNPLPLSIISLGQVGCNAYLSDIYFLNVTVFYPIGDPQLQHRGGIAECTLPIPNASWVLGVQLTTQWLDLIALNSSNAVAWSIAPCAPTLDMAVVDAGAGDAVGNVTAYRAHVLRFEYQ